MVSSLLSVPCLKFLKHSKLPGWFHSHREYPVCQSLLFLPTTAVSLIKEIALPCNILLTFTSTGWERLTPTEMVHFYHAPEAPVWALESRCRRDCQCHPAHTSPEFCSFASCTSQPFRPSLNQTRRFHLVKITSQKAWFLAQIICQFLR